jgi:asparagine synthase (glutamine-hydrolysing)
MISPDSVIHLVVNGEFYGYREIRQKHPFTTPPTRDKKDPMLAFYHDTFSSQAAKEQPIYDMQKANSALNNLFECSDEQRMATEASLQRIASAIIMQQKFGMS